MSETITTSTIPDRPETDIDKIIGRIDSLASTVVDDLTILKELAEKIYGAEPPVDERGADSPPTRSGRMGDIDLAFGKLDHYITEMHQQLMRLSTLA